MKFGVVLLGVAGLLVLSAAPCLSQPDPQIGPGTIEVGGGIGFSASALSRDEPYDPDDTWTVLDISFYPQIGYFLTENLEAEATLILSFTKATFHDESRNEDESNSYRNIGIIGRGVYNLTSQGSMVPYGFVGGGVIMRGYSDDEDNPYYNPPDETTLILPTAGAGARMFMGDRVAIRAEGVFNLTHNAGGVKDATQVDFGLFFGVTMLLGSQ